MPGQVGQEALEQDKIVHLLERIEDLPEVVDVALFGDRLRAVLRSADDAQTLESGLRSAGCGPLTVRATAPSLEDVFIHYIRQAGSKAPP